MEKKQKKKKWKLQQSLSRQTFQQIRELCRSQQLYVATKPRQNSRLKEHFYRDKEFYVATFLKKNEKKTVTTPLTLSRQ